MNRSNNEKPRNEGITAIIDKIQPLDIENFKNIVSFVDYVKIPQSCLLLYSPSELERRIKFYHEHNILVSIDSKSTEYAISNDSLDEYLCELLSFKFDILEIEVKVDNNIEENKKIADIVKPFNFELQWKFNKKSLGNNIYNDKILERVGELLKISKTKIILDIDRQFDLDIFTKSTNWKFISSLLTTYYQKNFIFETPIDSLQVHLIAKLGERVNLGLIDPFKVGLIEWTRRKYYSKLEMALGKQQNIPTFKNITGGPSVKFIYFIIKSIHPIDQTELMRVSELPRRTIQASISELKRQGVIIENLDPKDSRKRIYDLTFFDV
ncbi:MAG TPA: phosphosulfolactate synthase [Nitrososphaeraceae archaeon]|nr:phosphosulfolactate synthase [Nitrososphaeraceae archaeon]